MAGAYQELTALALLPNRQLREQFARVLEENGGFRMVAEMESYPTPQAFEGRLRKLRPAAVLLDLVTDLSIAEALIAAAVAFRPSIPVVALHLNNASEAILRSLRAGATEFLHAPFDGAVLRDAAQRIARLREAQAAAEPARGKVVVFSSAKPGSGASTLAWQTALALRRLVSGRILLADFDLWAGTAGFYFKLGSERSVLDALRLVEGEPLDAARWSSLAAASQGIDVLPSPETPPAGAIDANPLHQVLESARMAYEWIVLDLPPLFDRFSLSVLPESDQAFVVSTTELPSLHLARKAVQMLERLGVDSDRFSVLVNRAGKNEGITREAMGKIFRAPVHATFPNDYFSLHQALMAAEPLGPDSELGKTIAEFAGRLVEPLSAEPRKAGARTAEMMR
jgi:pilus assembly protein CpaE